MGHWHTYLALSDVIVNGSLKGYDEYARLAMRAPYEPPIQALFFVHPEHGITAQWGVQCSEDHSGLQAADGANEWLTWQSPK
jgi:hypothetical protein